MLLDRRTDMVRGRWITVAAVLTLIAAACTSNTETSPPPAPSATTLPAVTTTAPQETGPGQLTTTTADEAVDPWEITVVPVNDYASADMELGIEEIIDATAMVEARVEWIGEPGSGRWCCENPPLEVSDITVLGGDFPQDSDGKINGIDYQSLDASLEIGDRVTMLMRGHTALLIFSVDDGLAHPAPQHQADAIDAMRVREAESAGGWDPLDYAPLRAVSDIWKRYHTDWWGSLGQRTGLALSGVPTFPVVCSAADLDRLIAVSPYPPSNEGLPSTVDRMRNEIVAAATSCDYDKILSLTAFVDGDDTDLFWWSGGSTPEVFVEADRRFGALRQLVLALTNTAYTREEVNAENSSGEYVDQEFYVWPSAAVLIGAQNAAQSTVETLGEEEATRVAALNQMTVEELDESMRVFPGYALFRTAIDAAGRWRFALSGD
jgi:hypothetical protein